MALARYSALDRVAWPCSLLRSMLFVARRQSRYALRSLSSGLSFDELKPIKGSAYYQRLFHSCNKSASVVPRCPYFTGWPHVSERIFISALPAFVLTFNQSRVLPLT
jgi:hypothetical protein